jgi:antitoxin ParD1/3/4
MDITLPPGLEKVIEAEIASGRYESADEVIAEGLRLLHGRDASYETRREELVREIAMGLEQVERGEVVPLDINSLKREARDNFEKGRRQPAAKNRP